MLFNGPAIEHSPMGGRITVQLVSSLARLDLTNKKSMVLFVFSEAVESKLVKLETSCTGILPHPSSSRPLFSLMSSFQLSTENKCSVRIADDHVRPLISHPCNNHYPCHNNCPYYNNCHSYQYLMLQDW